MVSIWPDFQWGVQVVSQSRIEAWTSMRWPVGKVSVERAEAQGMGSQSRSSSVMWPVGEKWSQSSCQVVGFF